MEQHSLASAIGDIIGKPRRKADRPLVWSLDLTRGVKFTDALSLPLHECPEAVAFSILEPRGMREMTYRQSVGYAFAIADELRKKGVRKGDRVAVLSESRPEWASMFFACAILGCTTVPLDTRLGTQELWAILTHNEPAAIL